MLTTWNVLVFLLLIGSLLWMGIVFRGIRRERRALEEYVRNHPDQVVKHLNRAILRDPVSGEIKDDRQYKIRRFVRKAGLDPDSIDLSRAFRIVVSELSRLEWNPSDYFSPKNLRFSVGEDYELWVCDSLALFGWETQITKSSGDQGIDVIARKGTVSLGIQCKYISKPTGNSAVQQAFAGKHHYDLSYAAVMFESGYTKNARELASSTGVILLSSGDIPSFERILAI